MPQINFNDKADIKYCISNDLRDEQIKINIGKVKGRLEKQENEEKNEPIAIVCFAPSLNDTWEELKKFKYIMTCSGAHKFLIDRGIIPTWHVDLDPREHKVKILGQPHKDVEYLMASTIHPNYLDALKGYNVKLWHIFANQQEGQNVLPRGEWLFCGGSSVGLRCFTLSRFLGFKDFHIFGMDGSFGPSGSHTDVHPNAPKEGHETEYDGKKYLTTPSMLFVAKETFSELDQLDVKVKFYGDGLIQHMSRNYKYNPRKGAEIAYSKPELISEEYKKLNWRLHQDKPNYGMGGSRHKEPITKLSIELKTTSILDYGAGKMQLAKSLDFPIWSYDPAIPEISASPNPADIVVCTDVLEHIEPDKLKYVLDDLKRCVKKVGYFVISTRKAVKTYSNGKNTHLIVKSEGWWREKLEKFFDVGKIVPQKDEILVLVGPRTVKEFVSVVKEVDFCDQKVKFNVPTETIDWRVKTLFTKEPITIEWIKSLKKGETLIDVGANMGGYSMLASRLGVKVIAFEPESENYALLQKNIALNESDAIAYCAAVTDKTGIDKLYLSQRGVGGSCHSFGDNGDNKYVQGCVGLRLDDLNIKADHIKIDVDGQEPQVIAGAIKLLSNGVKTVLMEVNTNLESHKDMIKTMQRLGYIYDQSQVDAATRKDGPFKGCAEYLFEKKPDILENNRISNHIIERVHDTILNKSPFDFIYVEDVFPKDIYQKMINGLPEKKYVEIEKSRGTRGYPKRFTATPDDDFWKSMYCDLLLGNLSNELLDKFKIDCDVALVQDILLVRDEPGYCISPHTDSPHKVITVLFYLPKDDSNVDEGTSIFTPKQLGFICKTGKHYDFKDFDELVTLSFKPNSMFAFARKDNSFHGVQPTKSVRNVLLYNINKPK